MYKLNLKHWVTFVATTTGIVMMLLGNTPCGELEYDARATATASAKIEMTMRAGDK